MRLVNEMLWSNAFDPPMNIGLNCLQLYQCRIHDTQRSQRHQHRDQVQRPWTGGGLTLLSQCHNYCRWYYYLHAKCWQCSCVVSWWIVFKRLVDRHVWLVWA